MEKIKVGVVGATGYAGAEICRLIAGHPAAELAAISSVSFEGQALSDVYPAYREMCRPHLHHAGSGCGKKRCHSLPLCRTAFHRSLLRR